MKSSEPLPFAQWADIHRTEKFISIEAMSGYRMVQPEDNGCMFYLQPEVASERLGQTLLEALDRSRFIWPRDEPEFFKWQRYMRCHENRERDFMARYDYKTKIDLYKNMRWCRIERSEGKISIQPHQRREKPGEWKWLPPEQNVVIAETRDVVTVGVALRVALDRCE